jgi:hypothetical protein
MNIHTHIPQVRIHNPKIQNVPNLKLFEHRHDITSLMVQCTQTLFYAQRMRQYCIKLPPGYAYKVYVKHKWILCLDLGLINTWKYAEIKNTHGSKHFTWKIPSLYVIYQDKKGISKDDFNFFFFCGTRA